MKSALFFNEPHKVRIAAGEWLFREGDTPAFMYVLNSGKARVLVGSVEVEHLDEGALVGEMAMIEDVPRTASVQAVQECEFACINAPRFRFLITEMPGFALAVMRTMARRLRAANQFIKPDDDASNRQESQPG